MKLNRMMPAGVLVPAAALVLAILFAGVAAGDTIVTFPDANLEAGVRSALGIAASTPITSADMLNLGGFTSGLVDLYDLGGLEYAANLRVLGVAYARISDLRPITCLVELRNLVLYENRISDISPLKDLVALNSLCLGVNQISDIGMLGQLVNLTCLDLSENNVADIGALGTLLQLQVLVLESNQIQDISVLAALSQTRCLYLGNNHVSEIDSLKDLTHLTDLDLRGNTLNAAAYDTFIPEILANNPGINLLYDPLPEPGTCSLLGLGAVLVLRKLGKTRTMPCKGENA